MNEFIAKDCPEGYRFLVQLVDAPDSATAHQEINRMFGNRYSSCALFKSGTMRMKRNENGVVAIPTRWHESIAGFRIYVPKEFRL